MTRHLVKAMLVIVTAFFGVFCAASISIAASAQSGPTVIITVTRPAEASETTGTTCQFGVGSAADGTGAIQRVFVTDSKGVRTFRPYQLSVKDATGERRIVADLVGTVTPVNSQEACVARVNANMPSTGIFTVYIEDQEVTSFNMADPPKQIDLYTF